MSYDVILFQTEPPRDPEHLRAQEDLRDPVVPHDAYNGLIQDNDSD